MSCRTRAESSRASAPLERGIDPMKSIRDRRPMTTMEMCRWLTRRPTFRPGRSSRTTPTCSSRSVGIRNSGNVTSPTSSESRKVQSPASSPDLEASGCISHERIGRRNRYHINADATLRHPLESAITIGELIELITG